MGLRIIQHVREEYGGDADAHMKEEMNPFTNQSKARTKRTVESAPSDRQEVQVNVHDDDDGEERAGGFTVEGEDELGGGGFLPEGYDDEDVLQPEKVPVIEDDKQDGKPSPRGLAALATVKDGKHGESDSSLPTPNDMEEELDTDHPQPLTVRNGKGSKRSASRMTAKPQSSIVNGNKLKKVHALEREGEQSTASDARVIRSVPKRKAARKSETTVKSHYFGHSSEDDNGDSSDHDAGFKGKSTEAETTTRKRRALGVRDRR